MLGYGVFFRAMLLVLGCAVTGCATDEQPPPQAPRSAEFRSEAGLLVVATEDDGNQLKVAIERALVRAGYRVVATPDEPHELVVQVDVSVTEKQSILTVYVNGQVKKNYTAHASVSLLGEKHVLDVQTFDYDVDDGPSGDSLSAFVSAVGGRRVSNYLAASGKKRQSEAAAAAATLADEEDKKEEAQIARRRAEARKEEASWSQVVLSDCTNPTRVDGCDATKQFLTHFPAGKHAGEARRAVEAGSVLVAQLADERDWLLAQVQQCREPQASTDCEGVSRYVSVHPAGVHVEEARDALGRSQTRRAQLEQSQAQKDARDAVRAEQESAKEAAKAEREQKAAERAQCKKDCIGNWCFTLKPGPFEICMDRCIKANCD